ncbi:MAG: glutaredoxin domain-containing protein [Solirubrobacterales bacterium]
MEDTVNIATSISKTPKVTLYSKSNCSPCVRAKHLLEKVGAAYELVDLTGDLDGMQRVARLTGRMTLPQIVIGDEPIGGFEDLSLALQDPRIRGLLLAA